MKEEIIKRGYCLSEEYSELVKNGKLVRVKSEEGDESFWAYDLGDPNLFVLANFPISFWGAPRSLVGMVGYFNNGFMDHDKSIDLFKKAGQEAIDYYNRETKEDV